MAYLRLHLIDASICALILQASALAATVPNELHQGIADYNAGNYPAATSFLSTYLAKNLKNATAHYYLANSLLKMGQAENASIEYRKAYELAPANSQLRQYCVLALQKGISAQSPNAAPNEESETVASEDAAAAIPVEVTKALERIKQQSLVVKENKTNYANAAARDFITRGNSDENRLVWERTAKINQLMQPDMIDIHGRAIYLDHSSEIEQIRRDYAERIKQAHAVAEEESEKHRQLAAKETAKMLDDVENLRGQLTDNRGVTGSAKLRAVGTNLYTRQYGDPRMAFVQKVESTPDELLATPDKMILLPHAKPGESRYKVIKDPLVAEQEKLRNTPGTSLKVKASLIRK